jgi:hypothetical protein
MQSRGSVLTAIRLRARRQLGVYPDLTNTIRDADSPNESRYVRGRTRQALAVGAGRASASHGSGYLVGSGHAQPFPAWLRPPGRRPLPEQVSTEVDEALGPNLLQHAYDEFTFLSRILLPLYVAENRDKLPIPRPWQEPTKPPQEAGRTQPSPDRFFNSKYSNAPDRCFKAERSPHVGLLPVSLRH